MTMAVAGSTVWMAQPVWGQELAKERADLYFQEGKVLLYVCSAIDRSGMCDKLQG